MSDFSRTRPPPDWTGPERRKPGDFVTREEMESRLQEGRKTMTDHFDERFDDLERVLRDGFPGGNPAKHREVHEGFMQEAADARALWKSVKEKSITSGVWAGLGLLLLAVWEYLKVSVHK